MKKLYAVLFLFVFLILAGCSTEVVINEVEMTGEVEEITGEVEDMTGTEEIIIPNSEMEEFTGAFDSGEVSLVKGSEEVAAGTISKEVKSFIMNIKTLIDQRNIQPKDESKLTEEDIDLMEQIIEELKNL